MIPQVLTIALLVAAVGFLLTIPFQDVTRARVERFAWRQRLPITVDNGPAVIAYLATTRRWRGCGILATVAGTALAYTLRIIPSGHYNTFTLVVGWFIGAVIAEWRVNARAADPGRRTASLLPRTGSDYLAGWVRWSTRVVLTLTLAVELGAVIAGHDRSSAALLLALTVAATSGLWLGSRRILNRPQPDAAPDVLAADEAIRSRSLHVLSGSAIVLASWFGSLTTTLLVPVTDDSLESLQAGASLVALILGARIALHTSMPPRRLAARVAQGAVA